MRAKFQAMTELDVTRLAVGEMAPALCLPNQDKKTICLNNFLGQKVVIYFYPKDLTPGCTTQAAELTEILPKLSAAGYKVFGVSPDSPEKHLLFIERIGIGFDLLSDPEKSTMATWGTYGKKMTYGKESIGVIRSTFIVDEKGMITKATYATKATGHAARLAKELNI